MQLIETKDQDLVTLWKHQLGLKPQDSYKSICHQLTKIIRKTCQQHSLLFDSSTRKITLKTMDQIGLVVQPICQNLYLQIALSFAGDEFMLIQGRSPRHQVAYQIKLHRKEIFLIINRQKLGPVTRGSEKKQKQPTKESNESHAESKPGQSVTPTSNVYGLVLPDPVEIPPSPPPPLIGLASPISPVSSSSSSSSSADSSRPPSMPNTPESFDDDKANTQKRADHRKHSKQVQEQGYYIKGNAIENETFHRWFHQHHPFDSFKQDIEIAKDNLAYLIHAASLAKQWATKFSNLIRAIPYTELNNSPENSEWRMDCTACPKHCPPYYSAKRINTVGRPTGSGGDHLFIA